MKATGIVRRIDDLGRIVIPKEIRTTLRIHESDPMEIYTGDSGEIIFKKYSSMREISSAASKFASILHKELSMPVLITDRENVIATSGQNVKIFSEKRISQSAEKLLKDRKFFSSLGQPNEKLLPLEKSDIEAAIFLPIITNGDISGSLIILKSQDSKNSETKFQIANVVAKILASAIEN